MCQVLYVFIFQSKEEFHYVKGAVESILDKCKTVFDENNTVTTLTQKKKQEILEDAKQLGSRGLRGLS